VERYQKEFPADKFSRVVLGEYKFNKLGDSKGAIEAFNSVLKIDSNFYTAHFDLGVVYSGQANWPLAMYSFKRCTQIRPDVPESHHNLAAVYSNLSKFDSAVRYYTRAIDLKKDYWQAYFNRAVAWQSMKNNDKAIEDYTSVILSDSKSLNAYINRSKAYMEQKQWGLAIADMTTAVQLKSNDGGLWGLKAFQEYSAGKLDEACKSWQQAANLGNQQAKMYYLQFCQKR
jgi:Tfp pilus assembly protein PilF